MKTLLSVHPYGASAIAEDRLQLYCQWLRGRACLVAGVSYGGQDTEYLQAACKRRVISRTIPSPRPNNREACRSFVVGEPPALGAPHPRGIIPQFMRPLLDEVTVPFCAVSGQPRCLCLVVRRLHVPSWCASRSQPIRGAEAADAIDGDLVGCSSTFFLP